MSTTAANTATDAADTKRQKLKASDLPLSSATRNAIEELSHTFKKKGNYDGLRKNVWKEFEGSVCFDL